MDLTQRIPILDRDGKAGEWLAAGRGIAVWENVDLSSRDVGAYAFTPGDGNTPGWRYRLLARAGDSGARDGDGNAITGWPGFAFFRRGDVLAHWSDSPAGWKAAYRARNEIERLSTIHTEWAGHTWPSTDFRRMKLAGRSVLADLRRKWTAPAGTFARELTVERMTYQTSERVPYPLAPETLPAVDYVRPVDRPLDTFYRVGIVVWYAQIDVPVLETPASPVQS